MKITWRRVKYGKDHALGDNGFYLCGIQAAGEGVERPVKRPENPCKRCMAKLEKR